MASPVLELKSVSLSFGENKILSDVSLVINQGDVLVLMGPSGHGKSCLLKLLAGLLAPTRGELIVEGHNFFSLTEIERDVLRRKMGMLFQKNALFDSLTSAENIGFPLNETTTLSNIEIEKRISRFLTAVGLAEARDRYPDEISGGMQKRLGIARALALDPQIIFYDDPTAGLDPITSRKIMELIISLAREQGTTVVAVTNDMNRAYQLGHKLAMVVDGELIVTGTPEETKQHKDPRVHQFIRGDLKGPLTAMLESADQNHDSGARHD